MEIPLAEELGVSRQISIREAIRKLELKGFVVMVSPPRHLRCQHLFEGHH